MSEAPELAVLVMAKAPRPGLAKTRLEPLLGRERCARLQRALLARTTRWASSVGPAWIAYTPADARAEIAALAPAGVSLLAQAGDHLGARLAHAFESVASEHEGPVVVVGTDQPTLSTRHAWAVADDLRDGVDVTLGPATDGGYYLLAASRFHPALFAIAPDAWGGPDVLSQTIRSITEGGMSMGWLRWERDLDRPADVAALLADPCAPGDVVAALRG